MPYLAIHGSDTILLGDGATVYRAHELSLPAPKPLPWAEAARIAGLAVSGPTDDLATYSLQIDCLGASQAEAETALVALSNLLREHRARLVWRGHAGAPMLSTTIRSATVAEAGQFSLADRLGGSITVGVSIVADDSWTATDSTPIAPDAITGPGTFDVTVTDGDRPALARLKVTSASANEAIALGRKLAPAAGYAPIDTYSPPSAKSLTGDYAALASAPAIDTNANRGAHLVVPRVTTDAAVASSTRYRAVSAVTASGMADSAEAEYDSTAALATGGYRWTPLPGTIDIPAGGVPGIATGSGLSAEAALLNQTDATSSLYVEPQRTLEGEAVALYFYQTYTASGNEILTAFEFRVLTAPNPTTGWVLEVIHYRDGWDQVIDRSVPVPSMAAGTHKVAFADMDTVPGREYEFRVSAPPSDVDGYMTVAASSVSVYAGGTAGESFAGDVAKDLTCAVYGRVPLGFDSAVTIEGNCSEPSKTATLSHTGRLPAEGAWAVVRTFAAGGGIIVEDSDPLTAPSVYVTTSADGTAGPVVRPAASYGSLRPDVGVNRYIVLADGTVTVTGEYWPRYSHAAAAAL